MYLFVGCLLPSNCGDYPLFPRLFFRFWGYGVDLETFPDENSIPSSERSSRRNTPRGVRGSHPSNHGVPSLNLSGHGTTTCPLPVFEFIFFNARLCSFPLNGGRLLFFFCMFGLRFLPHAPIPCLACWAFLPCAHSLCCVQRRDSPHDSLREGQLERQRGDGTPGDPPLSQEEEGTAHGVHLRSKKALHRALLVKLGACCFFLVQTHPSIPAEV